ncbi:uncharacterized protein [Physcomitrium patens]|uniref:uncharacterized protein n=1 Tax=Physcomitrium patens TaxID=3218 RepID=UPI003CCD71A0
MAMPWRELSKGWRRRGASGSRVGMLEWTGLRAQDSGVLFGPVNSGSVLDLRSHHCHHYHHHHHHRKSPPPPSPPPPPPPPRAILSSLELSNAFILDPPIAPSIHKYTTTVGEYVSKVHIIVSVPPDIQAYRLTVNSSNLLSGEESPPIVIGNGEWVDVVVTISAPSHSSNRYLISIYRLEKSSLK